MVARRLAYFGGRGYRQCEIARFVGYDEVVLRDADRMIEGRLVSRLSIDFVRTDTRGLR